MRARRQSSRLGLERLEARLALNGDCGHNSDLPMDVNQDAYVSPLDLLILVDRLNEEGAAACVIEGESPAILPDVTNDGWLSPIDALVTINHLNSISDAAEVARRDAALTAELAATINDFEKLGAQNLLTAEDVKTLLERASQASPSTDAIIAVVDRAGRILGVRVEAGVHPEIKNDPDKLAFAVDGAVAKARTAAFFSSNAAPLPSRTVRFISQSTITQREVESSPLNKDEAYRGPGFVAPIGVGGHFPPEVSFTPQVDLFAIEHQSRDRQAIDPGSDGKLGSHDDLLLERRFNVHPLDIAQPKPGEKDTFEAVGADEFFATWPESYGVQSGKSPQSQARGIATLPGGIPLYKAVTQKNAQDEFELAPVSANARPRLPKVNLVGGIGVFFPGADGFATHEQGFVPQDQNGGVAQSEGQRTNAPRVIESEFIALAAAAGTSNAQVDQLLRDQNLDAPTIGVSGTQFFKRDFREFDRQLSPLPTFTALNGRIDLVGITLEIYGPTPTRHNPLPGIDQLIQFGRSLGPLGVSSGEDIPVEPGGARYLAGNAVPEGWLVVPHDASDGSLTAEDVRQMITQGVEEASLTRAAIRLDVDDNFRPGERTSMVLAVADTNGELLGLYRMPDATVFSIDVSIAKARNTAYYADANALVDADRIDFNNDGVFGAVTTQINVGGDTVPRGTALTNRTFRFLVEPRYPTGAELPQAAPGPQSILIMPGINPATAENSGAPLPFSVYADPTAPSTTAFDAFVPSRNFRDPGDAGVTIAGTHISHPLANQNGVVFFPGSTPVYVERKLAGGLGVSGDGVDQDDVVTAASQVGFAAPDDIRVDQYFVGNVRLPFQKFNRNPQGT